MSTPIFDELEAEWNFTDHYRAICDEHWTVTHLATGQVWYEDDEGNEVFPEPRYADGGVVKGVDIAPLLLPTKLVLVMDNTKVAYSVGKPKPKRKRKLFGRNQGTNGTL